MNRQLRLLFTALMAVFVTVGSWAQTEFSIKFQNSSTVDESTPDYFTYNKGEGTAVSWSSKGKHSCTYGGDTYDNVIKMESATQAYFTSTAEATVTIVQTISNATGDKLKFDGTNLDANMENTTVTVDEVNKYNEYVITKVAAGKHTITRQSETGLAYIKVVYTGAAMETLATPEITIDTATGEVTIGAVENATSIVYTTDGTDPSATNGEVYSEAFTVEDGTTVKAIALGDNENYANSEIASEQAILDVTSIADPTFVIVNGSVAISCETIGTTIYYSTDGSTFNEYNGTFTLTESGTVYAYAKRGTIVSTTVSENVEAIGKGDANVTVTLDFTTMDVQTVDGLSTMVGKSGTDNEGYSIVLNNSQKTWSNGVGDKASYIKLSNGAENILKLPEGVSATRMTIYSFINSDKNTTENGWEKVNGVSYAYKTYPMVAYNGVSTPDVRVYALEGTETNISFNNKGNQLLFYIVLDVINANEKAPLTAAYEPAEISIMSNETLEQPTLTITDEAGEAVDGLTISYESDNTNVATVDETGAISLTGAAGEATITATIDGGDNYRSTTASVTITVIDANSVLTVTENTEVVLTQENIEAEGYMSASTDNWVTNKNYGGYEGDFYNMSKSGRNITIKVQGAKAFEVLVQNSTAGRTYQIAPGATSTTEITHQGGGVESSGIIECSGEQMELVISGGGTTAGSVYPVAIRFYTEVPEQITISSVGYATLYYSDKAFEIPSGVTASIVTSVEGGKITFEELSEVIPAGTGVVLKGNEGTYNFAIATTQANASENNLLRGSDEAATTTGGDLYYMLSLNANSDEGSVGFYWGDAEGGAFENSAHKAYLAVANSTDAKSFYLFEENTTGIDAVQGARQNAQDMEIYNLNGQRVMNARKGIYIVNGRKVVVR